MNKTWTLKTLSFLSLIGSATWLLATTGRIPTGIVTAVVVQSLFIFGTLAAAAAFWRTTFGDEGGRRDRLEATVGVLLLVVGLGTEFGRESLAFSLTALALSAAAVALSWWSNLRRLPPSCSRRQRDGRR